MFKASEITSKEYKAIPLKAEYQDFLGRFSQDGSILMSGSPGGGKSTLALQLLADMLRHGNALYIPAEEGADSFTTQEKIKRLNIPEEIYLAEWEGFEKLKDDIRDHSIRYVCLDSITYIDKHLSEFDDFRLWCKERDIVLIVIAHSTKSGSYKGSSDLEHMVDTSIWVYPDSDDRKFAKTKKNRFGPCPKEIEIIMEAEERENPGLGTPSKVSITDNGIDLFYGLEYVQLSDEEARENKGVSPDDIYQMITDRIISTLKKSGKLPWHKPWKGSGIGKGLGARNYISKKPYRGINWVMLNTEYKDGSLRLRSFSNPYFMTFNQVEKLGGKVKKGSKGNEVVYFTKLYRYKQYDPDLEYGTYSPQKMAAWLRKNASKVLGKDRVVIRSDGIQATTKNPSTIDELVSTVLSGYVPILKYYKVFHASDIDGIEWKDLPETNEEKTEFQRIETAESIWENYSNAPKIVHQEQQAYYTPVLDRINMPIKESFDNEQFYYSTLFHEGVHSTGHPKRLDRDLSGRFGNEKYAFEELIAELGATFLCAESGILFQTIDNSQAYLQGWSKRLIKNLEDDNRFFFRASSRAQEATDHMLNRDSSGVPAYRKDVDVSTDENENAEKVTKIKSARTTNIDKGYSVGITQEGKTVVFKRSDYDNNGNLKGSYKVLGGKDAFHKASGMLTDDVLKEMGWSRSDVKAVDSEILEFIKSTTCESTPEKEETSEKAKGAAVKVDFKADGSQSVPAQYTIIEATDLIPSHHPDGSVNPKHTINKGQPRDRSSKEIKNQPYKIVDNFNPASITVGNLAFNGAPVVNPTNEVIQGNGRSIALKILYREGSERKQNAYRSYLKQNASQFGFSGDDVDSYTQPVLVRKVIVDKKEAIRLGNITDTSQAKMPLIDQAKAAIRNLSIQQRRGIGVLINNSKAETLGEVLDVNGERILKLFRDIDLTGLIDDDGITSEGKDFIRNVFKGLVFDSEENKGAIKYFARCSHTVKAGIERSYGHILPFVSTEKDIAPVLQKAVEIVAKVQESTAISTVAEFMKEGDAFEGLNKDRFDDEETQVADRLLKAKTQKEIRFRFAEYEKHVAGYSDLLENIDEKPRKEAINITFGAAKLERVNPETTAPEFLYFDRLTKVQRGVSSKFGKHKVDRHYARYTNAAGKEKSFWYEVKHASKPRAPYIPVIGTKEDLKRDQNQVNGYKVTKKAASSSRENPRKPISYTSILALFEDAQSDKNNKGFFEISVANEDVTDLVAQALGKDISEFKHIIHADAIRHVIKEHGSADSERKRGQLAVKASDFALLPEVFSEPDKVTLGGKSKIGRQTLIYEKAFDQKVICVEEIWEGRKRLSLKTMRKYNITALRANSEECVAQTSKTFRDRNTSSGGKNTKFPNDRQNPDPLVFIGFCEQIHILQNGNIPWMAGKFPMFTNAAGTKLYIVPQKRVKAVRNKVDDEKATEMFETWSHYPASFKDFEIDLPDGKGKSVGTAHKIFYASDKVMQPGDKKGKVNRYKHDFDPNKRPAKVIDDVLIIENIKITGRGIMN